MLGPDTAGVFTRSAVTADIIDFHAREYERAFRVAGSEAHEADSPQAMRALLRLADVEDRHLVLVGAECGHDTLSLAELAVTHRRQLSGRNSAVHLPLLGLSLVQLTHQLHTAGRFGDAVATGEEAVDKLSRYHGDRDARPALVLALDVSVTTCLVNGRRHDAVHKLRRATALLTEIAHEDHAYADDLVVHRRMLAGASTDATPRRAVRSPAASPGHEIGTEVLRSTVRSTADDLYDDAVHLCISDGDGPAAAATAGAAVTAFRRALSDHPAHGWHRALRKLSRALWRHSTIVAELLARPRDAIGPGREALAMIRRVIRAIEQPEEFDELVGEFGLQLFDLAHTARVAGMVGAHDQLAEEARRLTVDSVGHGAVRAVGAALHQRAAEACETAVALAVRGRASTPTVRAGIANSAHAVKLRRALVTDDPISLWELANAQLAHGHLRCLDGQSQLGAQSMADAYRSVRTMPGPAGQTMRDAAEAALIAACSANPDIEPRDDWPL